MTKKINLEQAWQLAIQNEQDARELYEELGRMVDDSALKKLFAYLVEQEINHKRMLEEEFEKYFSPEF